MIVRRYSESDLGAVLDLHRRQGLDYELPSLENCPVGCVIEEGGNITHALFLRRTLETYWLFDKEREWKRQTLGRFLALHTVCEPIAADLGYTDVHAFVPPQIDDNKFNLTMIKMGWHKSEWPSYARNIVPVQEEAIK